MKHVQTAITKILPRNRSFAEKHENIAPRKLPAIWYVLCQYFYCQLWQPLPYVGRVKEIYGIYKLGVHMLSLAAVRV